jgi:hypothetical protein
MKLFRFLIPAAIMCLGLTINVKPAQGKPEYTKKEKKACTTCHSSAKPTKENEALNAVGKCYKGKKELSACADAK